MPGWCRGCHIGNCWRVWLLQHPFVEQSRFHEEIEDMTRGDTNPWAKRKLDKIRRELLNPTLTPVRRTQLEHLAEVLSEIRTAHWLPTGWESRLAVALTAPMLLANVLLLSVGGHHQYEAVPIWLTVLGYHSPRINAEVRYALSRVFSHVR